MGSSKRNCVEDKKELVIQWFDEGIPATEVCSRLGIRKLSTLKSNCHKLGIAWKTHAGWCSGRNHIGLGSLDAAIANKSNKAVIKRYLILERGHKCEYCKNSLWQSMPIPLEVHHIDGNPFNNGKDNLQLLCPNCHSLTTNFCGKNIDPKKLLLKRQSSKKEAYEQQLLSKHGKRKLNLGEGSKLSEEEIERRKSIIMESIPGNYGWVVRAASALNTSHTQIRRFVKKYMPNLIRHERSIPGSSAGRASAR